MKFPSGGMKERTLSDSQRLKRTQGWKLTSSRRRGFCNHSIGTGLKWDRFWRASPSHTDTHTHIHTHTLTRTGTHHERECQVRHPRKFHTGFNHSLDLRKHCCTWTPTDAVLEKLHFTATRLFLLSIKFTFQVNVPFGTSTTIGIQCKCQCIFNYCSYAS